MTDEVQTTPLDEAQPDPSDVQDAPNLDDLPVVDPNPLGVDVEEAAQSLIYGGIGENMNAPRRLVAMVDLPDRRELTWQARNLLMESDIREAMAKAAYKLHAHYLQRDYNNIGYVFNPDLIEYDLTRLKKGMDIGADTQEKGTESLARVLVATVVISRP